MEAHSMSSLPRNSLPLQLLKARINSGDYQKNAESMKLDASRRNYSTVLDPATKLIRKEQWRSRKKYSFQFRNIIIQKLRQYYQHPYPRNNYSTLTSRRPLPPTLLPAAPSNRLLSQGVGPVQLELPVRRRLGRAGRQREAPDVWLVVLLHGHGTGHAALHTWWR